jgi:hypothetical protein
VKPYLVLGHLVIAVLCVLVAMVFNGLFVTTTYSVNGVNIAGLSSAAIMEKLRTGPLVASTNIGPWIEFPLPGPELGSLVMPATAGLLLLLVYGPGFIWPAAKRLPVRLGITGAFVVATVVLMGRL